MNTRIVVGSAIILLGLSFLIDFPFFNIFFALLLIYLGIRFIRGEGLGFSLDKSQRLSSAADSFSRVMVFTGTQIQSESRDFQGGEFVSVFAEGEIDLRKAKTSRASNALHLVCVFGTLKVRVPADWEVDTEGVGILGAFRNASARPESPKSKLQIEGASVFGNIEISN